MNEIMKNILLVENDDMSIKLILYFLKNLYHIDVAKDGITALKMVKEKKYSAVLMDIDLGPCINGLEVVNKIIGFQEYKDVPIVAVTAYASKGDENEFLAHGCNYYISKPFQKNKLLSLLNSIT